MIKKLARILAVEAVLLLVVAAVLVFGGFVRAPRIRSVHLSWGEITDDFSRVNAEIVVDNPGRISLGAAGIRLRVPVDFYSTRVLSLEQSGVRLPRGQSTLRLSGMFRQSELPQWWPQFVRNNERLAIRVKPRVEAPFLSRILGVDLGTINATESIPLLERMKSTGATTVGFDNASLEEIVRDPARHLVIAPSRPARPIVTVESWELHWGIADRSTSRIVGTVIARNETGVPLPVDALRIAIDLNGLPVLPDTRVTPDRRLLGPGESTPMRIEGSLDNARFVSWWTSHLQGKETTTGVARMGLVIAIPGVIAPGLEGPLELPLMPLAGFTCRLRTDIMASANYEINRSLGQPVGPAPQAVAAQCG